MGKSGVTVSRGSAGQGSSPADAHFLGQWCCCIIGHVSSEGWWPRTAPGLGRAGWAEQGSPEPCGALSTLLLGTQAAGLGAEFSFTPQGLSSHSGNGEAGNHLVTRPSGCQSGSQDPPQLPFPPGRQSNFCPLSHMPRRVLILITSLGACRNSLSTEN